MPQYTSRYSSVVFYQVLFDANLTNELQNYRFQYHGRVDFDFLDDLYTPNSEIYRTFEELESAINEIDPESLLADALIIHYLNIAKELITLVLNLINAIQNGDEPYQGSMLDGLADAIAVTFENNQVYTYAIAEHGQHTIEEMIKLAERNSGLNSFIYNNFIR